MVENSTKQGLCSSLDLFGSHKYSFTLGSEVRLRLSAICQGFSPAE